MTAALSLAAKGFRVIILEKAERLEEAGAGLQLSPNASRILVDLGNDNEIICPYCSTLYRFATDLKAGEARPPECVLKDKVA